MPYSTRRVSLNLQSLGVQIPQSRGSHRSPPNPTPTTAGTAEHPPAKRIKRSHTIDTSGTPSSITIASRPRPRKSISSIPEKPTALAQFTPPPSPGTSAISKTIDTQDIKDDIVVAVIEQLQKTGNKPHQIKDLADILSDILEVVEKSANRVAIISSRLTNYLKRPCWTALAPCPLAKEQVTVHPRRVYYFLTTTPRQEIPEYTNTPNLKTPRHIITPSVSSSEPSSDLFERDREDLSPESEFEFISSVPDAHQNDLHANGIAEIHFTDNDFDVDASMADIEEPSPPAVTHSTHPPLEHDEREFSQTAGAMRQRKESEQAESRRASRPPSAGDEREEGRDHGDRAAYPFPQIHEEPDVMDQDAHTGEYSQHQDSTFLFGGQGQNSGFPHHEFTSASPMIRPVVQMQKGTPRKLHVQTMSAPDSMSVFAWSDLKSPENLELTELDDLLGGV